MNPNEKSKQINEGFLWSDILDTESEQLGQYVMYRNYRKKEKDDDNKKKTLALKYEYSIYSRDSANSLWKTDPIAIGVTAYLCFLKNRGVEISKFKQEMIGYYNMKLKLGNDNFDDFSKDFNEIVFCSEHQIEENEHYHKSRKMFSEVTDDEDLVLKEKIKDAANWYLRWLDDHLKELEQTGQGNTNSLREVKDIVFPDKLESLEDKLKKACLINENWKWIGAPPKNAAILIKSLLAWNYTDKSLNPSEVKAILYGTFGEICKDSTIEHAKPESDIDVFLKIASNKS